MAYIKLRESHKNELLFFFFFFLFFFLSYDDDKEEIGMAMEITGGSVKQQTVLLCLLNISTDLR